MNLRFEVNKLNYTLNKIVEDKFKFFISKERNNLLDYERYEIVRYDNIHDNCTDIHLKDYWLNRTYLLVKFSPEFLEDIDFDDE